MAIAASGAIVFDTCGRLLLVRRRFPPEAGSWSIPGGKSLTGEHPATTCVRETKEETDLTVAVTAFVGCVSRPAPDGETFVINDFRCRLVSGAIRCGDDATAVGWFGRSQLGELSLATGLFDALEGWGLLPR